MDILRYPSCKLYKNGSFRLPAVIKKEFESRRYKKIVIIDAPQQSSMLYPVSIWDKIKKDHISHLQYSKYPQTLNKVFMQLQPELVKHLGYTDKLFFLIKADGCMIINRIRYEELNFSRIEKMNELYDTL